MNDISSYAKLNSLYTNTIDGSNAPVRICLETNLPSDSAVLLDAVAHKTVSASPPGIERRTMHVQSISHWAPANIGPYSQAIRVLESNTVVSYVRLVENSHFSCVQVGDIIYVAGQIALIPGSMQMVDGGISQECRLSLRHVERIINGVDQNTLLRDVVQVIASVRQFVRRLLRTRNLYEFVSGHLLFDRSRIHTSGEARMGKTIE